MNKKIFSIILSAIMAVVFIPSFAFADVAADDAQGDAVAGTLATDIDIPSDVEFGAASDDLAFDAQSVPEVNMISATRYGNSIKVKWSSTWDTDDVVYSVIYCSTPSSNLSDWSLYEGDEKIYIDANGNFYTNLSKLAVNKTRYFAIFTYNNYDKSNAVSNNYVKYTPVLRTPTLTATVTGTTSVKLSWTKDTYATSYKIYRATSKSGSYKCIKTIKGYSTTSYTNTGLTKNRTYYFKVRAYRNTSTYKTSSIKSAKPRANVSPWINSYADKKYGGPFMEKGQVSYSSGAAVFKVKVYNYSKHKAQKFNNITLSIYDNNDNLIAKQKFYNVSLNLGAYKTTYKTFKFKYSNTYRHSTNLRYLNSKADFDYEYVYTYYR